MQPPPQFGSSCSPPLGFGASLGLCPQVFIMQHSSVTASTLRAASRSRSFCPPNSPPVPSPCILRSTVTKSVQVWPTSSSHCCSKLPHGLPQDVTARVLHHALPHRTRFTQLDFSSLNPVPSPPGGPLSIGLAMPLPVPSSPCRPSRRPRFMVTIATLHYSFVKRPTPRDRTDPRPPSGICRPVPGPSRAWRSAPANHGHPDNSPVIAPTPRIIL